MIDAVDLEAYEAVYLVREVPDGLDHLLAPGVRLLFGADEDDSVSSLHAVFHNQGDNLGGIEAGKGDVGLHQEIVLILWINAFLCYDCIILQMKAGQGELVRGETKQEC